jgi:hypothetical protein
MSRFAWAVLLLALAALLGCEQPSHGGRPDKVARAYVRTAAAGDTDRLCTLRTKRGLRAWGGLAACRRRAEGLAIDPRGGGRTRRAARVRASDLVLLASDISIYDDRAAVMFDFGETYLEGGHAVGGTVLQMRLRLVRPGVYRIDALGFATFAD